MDIDRIKTWLKIEFDFENEMIEEIIESAKVELLLSGVPMYEKYTVEYSLYCTAVKYIVARDYESRGYTNDQSKSKTFNERALQRMILKLKKW
ncbi:head-tail connector protein [Staphylococcus saprophyticus]|uniref:head-tail connector protein n=1 Tax=Staphylococcus TaxID=1279 RepID=UPI0008535FC1|nr:MULTISPECIES: head-tail connector protein [Staphylococcus]MBF2751528.1 phage head-tail connector protein [Staphylococcus saprophyticus]MDW4367100.1 head-tail connector protein [Staphylococcus saprophyticus]OEK94367.1 phage head-tail adapter protein [Staphylococcus saprophyticus]